MKFNYFIGCDVSKNELDFAVIRGQKILLEKEIDNNEIAIKTFFKSLRELH